MTIKTLLLSARNASLVSCHMERADKGWLGFGANTSNRRKIKRAINHILHTFNDCHDILGTTLNLAITLLEKRRSVFQQELAKKTLPSLHFMSQLDHTSQLDYILCLGRSFVSDLLFVSPRKSALSHNLALSKWITSLGFSYFKAVESLQR